ncbi:MAG: SOS response-associated peptidase family protein [Bdellovibrionota bacterium]
MCAEYTFKGTSKDLEEALKAKVIVLTDSKSWDQHVRLFAKAPVITTDGENLNVTAMSFSMKPTTTPFPAFNARLSGWDERRKKMLKVYERPTWKKPFERQRCLIPMTGFIEPIYLGEHAGSAMEFHRKDKEIFFVAGLYDGTSETKSGEVYEGFAPILHTPSPYILKMGHHREVLQLKPTDALKWLEDQEMSNEDRFKFLIDQRHQPNLEAVKARNLAKGWEKRISDYEQKLKKEMSYIAQMEEAN